MSEIVILGVFVADTAYRASRQPKMGETLMASGFSLGPGGKGSNQAVAAARAGGKVSIITRLGEDAFGDLAMKTWTDAGVSAAVIRDPHSYTGAAYIFIEEGTGNNAIIVAPGAAAGISTRDIEANRALISSAKVFVTQLEQPVDAAREALAIAKSSGAITILNPAPAVPLDEGLLALCDYVTPNETETEILTGMAVTNLDQARAAGDRLIAMGARVALITLGSQGALFHAADRSELLPAYNAGPVVETTGAGDAFNGGFAAALASGLDPVAAARFGCATAGISVTRPGTAPAMPSLAEIQALLASG